MMLEILERSGHIKGKQPASLTPRHTRIRSPCSQGSVTEHSSQTWHKKGKECHILGSEPQKKKIRSKRKAWSLPWPKQDSLSHTGNTFPLMDFPCPLTLANKAVCTRWPHEREGVKLISTSQEMVLLMWFIQLLQLVPEETLVTFRGFHAFSFKFQVESFNIPYQWVSP